MKLKDILHTQGKREIVKIEPNCRVREAMQLIVKRKIGALLVQEKSEKLVGIITERDILWHMFDVGEDVFDKSVEDIMTRKVIVGIPDDDIEVAEQFMTFNRFRHLPVVEGDKVVGLISIGDLVKSQIGSLKVENRYLTDYITGKYPA